MRFRVPEKLAMTLCFLVTSLTAPPLLSLVLVSVILIARWIVAGVEFLEGVILFQAAGIPFYEGGIAFGIHTGARLLLMTSALLLLFGSTPLSGITTFLHQMGVPAQIVMTVHLTVHFVASIPSRIERIYSAQEARGAPVRAHVVSRILSLGAILSPLILSSIVESIERGKALELRGYNSASKWIDDTTPLSARFSFLTTFFLLLSLIALFLPWLLG